MGLSPMMQEYVNTKEKYKDAILLYRLGDFYEMFFDDAILVSKELELTLTGKACGLEEKAPMCGVPQASVDIYIAKLIEKGYKVAICDQLEDPKEAKGLVKRGVTRVVTPGTITELNMLDDKKYNYIMSIYYDKIRYYIASADISTSDYYVTEVKTKENVYDEISRFSPSEIIINEELSKDKKFKNNLKEIMNIYVTEKENSYFDLDKEDEEEILKSYTFEKRTLSNSLSKEDNVAITYTLKDTVKQNTIFDMFGEDEGNNELVENLIDKEKENNTDGENKKESLNEKVEDNTWIKTNISKAIIAIHKYIQETQLSEITNLRNIYMYSFDGYMALDRTARRNLEINSRMIDGSKKGSLLWILDKTNTSMGARLLSRWVNDPLISKEDIESRLDGVEELKNNIILRGELKTLLKKIYDIERIAGKIAFSNINGKDMISLKNSIMYLPDIKEELKNTKSTILKNIYLDIDTLKDIYKLIDEMIVENPPITITEGGLIKESFNEEIYNLKHLGETGRKWIASLEETERENTDIKNLKIGYNKVFGYYIEVTNANLSKVPETYIRKQTLRNAERFVTPELKEMEEELLNAEEKVKKLEYELFMNLRKTISEEVTRIKRASDNIAKIDVLTSFAEVAENNNYTRPSINNEGIIDIKGGRHPVVEKTMKDQEFVKNDTKLDQEKDTIMIITGPNMAGKSTYMRQVALITMMSQIGCFVPADSANISIVDKIFTRIGASDDLSRGQSTFMLEMAEVSNILNGATKNSLVILDEIGRGTSTYDGMSIAKAVLEYISEKIKAKTLFATHYHELTQMGDEFSNIQNYHVEAKEKDGDVLFLRKVVPGGTDQSYGIHVAKLAGVPKEVLRNANSILSKIEMENKVIKEIAYNEESAKDLGKEIEKEKEKENTIREVPNMFEIQYHNVIDELKKVDINNMTPMNAFDFLNDILGKMQ